MNKKITKNSKNFKGDFHKKFLIIFHQINL